MELVLSPRMNIYMQQLMQYRLAMPLGNHLRHRSLATFKTMHQAGKLLIMKSDIAIQAWLSKICLRILISTKSSTMHHLWSWIWLESGVGMNLCQAIFLGGMPYVYYLLYHQ